MSKCHFSFSKMVVKHVQTMHGSFGYICLNGFDFCVGMILFLRGQFYSVKMISDLTNKLSLSKHTYFTQFLHKIVI